MAPKKITAPAAETPASDQPSPAPAPAPAPTETPAKRKQADHGFINASGAATEEQTEATGITYKDVKTGESFSFQIPGAVAGSVATMLAIFGAKTLATNTASGNRNAENGPTVTDVKAIDTRFSELKENQWAEAGEGARGPKVDITILAGVLASFAEAAGKPADAGHYAQKLTDDLAYRRSVMGVTEIKAEYQKRIGGKVATVADVL